MSSSVDNVLYNIKEAIEACKNCAVRSIEDKMDCWKHCEAASDVLWTTHNIVIYKGLNELENKMLEASEIACQRCNDICKTHESDHCQRCAKSCAGVVDSIKKYRAASH